MSQQISIIQDTEGRQLTAASVRTHVNLIQDVMKGIMKDGTHYGKIPGCNKPTLFKAGSEVLLTTFRIAVEPEVEDLSTPDCVRYRVRAKGIHQTTGIVVGIGIGECSSDEDKYKWRSTKGKAEFDNTPQDRRRIKHSIAYGKETTTKQVRVEPADVANTVLKMAKKRAQIDLTLTATSASDIFTQDVEDLPEELVGTAEDATTKAQVDQPTSKSNKKPADNNTEHADTNKKLMDGQIRILRAKMTSNNISEEQLKNKFGKPINELLFSQFQQIQAWVMGQG